MARIGWKGSWILLLHARDQVAVPRNPIHIMRHTLGSLTRSAILENLTRDTTLQSCSCLRFHGFRGAWQRHGNGCYGWYMALRAKVENGRIVVDEPTTLPEGTVLDLVVDDEGDDLDDEERARLHARLDAAWASAQAGNVRSAADVIAKLRRS